MDLTDALLIWAAKDGNDEYDLSIIPCRELDTYMVTLWLSPERVTKHLLSGMEQRNQPALFKRLNAMKLKLDKEHLEDAETRKSSPASPGTLSPPPAQ